MSLEIDTEQLLEARSTSLHTRANYLMTIISVMTTYEVICDTHQ